MTRALNADRTRKPGAAAGQRTVKNGVYCRLSSKVPGLTFEFLAAMAPRDCENPGLLRRVLTERHSVCGASQCRGNSELSWWNQDIEGCAAISAYTRAATNPPARNCETLSACPPHPRLQWRTKRPGPPSLSPSRDAVELKGCRTSFSVDPAYGNCIPFPFLVR